MSSEFIKQNRSWLLSGSIALLVAAWLISGQFSDKDKQPLSRPVVTASPAESSVRVRTQSAERVTRTIVVNGKTAPARGVEISAETDGRVVAVDAARGASVDQGELILRLDERDRKARLAQAEATVKQREVEYQARLKLQSESYVSEAQLQEAVALLETARAELLRAQLDLEYMLVRAPFDGALQTRHVEIGDFVKQGDPLASFVDNRSIIVSANLSEFDAGYVTVGQEATAGLATGEEVSGVIRYIAPVADEATRTFLVELEVDNRDGRLLAGGTAELRVPAEEILAHRISPALLTLDDAGNVGIKIIDDNGEVAFVSADIALSNAEGVWVAGLPETATIITVGQGFVSSGSVVNAVPESDIPTALAVRSETEE